MMAGSLTNDQIKVAVEFSKEVQDGDGRIAAKEEDTTRSLPPEIPNVLSFHAVF